MTGVWPSPCGRPLDLCREMTRFSVPGIKLVLARATARRLQLVVQICVKIGSQQQTQTSIIMAVVVCINVRNRACHP